MKATLVSIAGFDPTGGAGVLLDAAVFARMGFRGAGVVSALTAQTADRVSAVQAVSAAFLKKQFVTLRVNTTPAGIKVGMLGSAANLAETARILSRETGIPRVVDPVLRSSSGRMLLEKAAWPSFLKKFKGRMTLITPNLDEAGLLSGRPVRDKSAMKEAARKISGQAECPCLIKGGHLGSQPLDILWDGRIFEEYRHEKIKGDAHGTGCFLSSAVLGYLARGESLAGACRKAIALTHGAIRTAVMTARPPDTVRRFLLL